MLNVMKIPWIEKCPWIASVATPYFVNGLARQPGQKETSLMKILPAMHRGRLAALLLAVIPPKGFVIWFLGRGFYFLTCLSPL